MAGKQAASGLAPARAKRCAGTAPGLPTATRRSLPFAQATTVLH